MRALSFPASQAANDLSKLTPVGSAETLTCGGKIFRATEGVPLQVRGLPKYFKDRRYVKFSLDVCTIYGEAVAGALVTPSTGRMVAKTLTDPRSTATLRLKTPRCGVLRVGVSPWVFPAKAEGLSQTPPLRKIMR